MHNLNADHMDEYDGLNNLLLEGNTMEMIHVFQEWSLIGVFCI